MNGQNRKYSLNRKILNSFISVFCVIVTITVIWVLLFLMDPERCSSRALGSTCMDIVCMIVAMIIVVSLIIERQTMGLTTKLFLAMLMVTKWALYFDFLTWSLDGTLEYGNWTYVFTTASLVSGSILAAIFVLYLSSYMDDLYGLKAAWRSARICFVINLISFVLTLILALTKTAFTFENGHYEVGVLYDAITVLPILTLIYFSIYAISHVKTIGIHDAVTMAVYIVILITGAIAEAVLGIGTTYVAVTIADVLIFMMLQYGLIQKEKKQKELLAERVDAEMLRAEEWMKKSSLDEVTGFYNRYAYEEEIAKLVRNGLAPDFVYMSMDVNGLKVVNDTMGHDAGDELIVGACSCIRHSFGRFGKLYRTGGDEFAALLYINDQDLAEAEKEFRDTCSKWRGKLNDSLSVSYRTVSAREAESMSIRQMAVMADQNMYENKAGYYAEKGIDRRGQSDAHVALYALYTKILRINIQEDSYQIVDLNPAEKAEEQQSASRLSKWMRRFAESGGVHPEDLPRYLAGTDLSAIRTHFSTASSPYRVFYRRKIQGEYKQVMLEIIPANWHETTDGDTTISDTKLGNYFLYVKDIEGSGTVSQS